ncbi:MAG TPA: PEP-CTERM sorting domain-containing protein, partial [Lacipirellula sp.]
WQEAVPSGGRVSELNPTSALTINPGGSISFAGLWNPAGPQDAGDLSFQYRDTTVGTLTGAVEFASSADGDYDNNNVVDGRDFLVWQRGGSPDSLSSADLAAWQDNFGSGVSAGAFVASVPEPGSALLIVVGLGLAAVHKRGR